MNYLYGDSTTSALTSNFLEFLRDALDFAVFVLQADSRIREGRVQIRELAEAADEETQRLERFIANVSDAVHVGDKGTADSPTAQCAARIAALVADSHRASVEGIRQTLTDAIARIEAEDAAARDSCVKALGALLAPHDPPGTTTFLQLALGDGGRYRATLDAKSEPSLAWMLEVAIPDGHAWSSLMRIDRLVPHLEIRTPQLAGWITKEVKIRPQKLERLPVTKVVYDGESLGFHLRTESSHDVGFDFVASLADGTVRATRIGGADDASVGPFEVHPEDVPLVLDVAKKLHASVQGLERRPNVGAMFDGVDFRKLPNFSDFIDRLVDTLAPIVREIAQRSLTPNELILRRPLGDDRREEIFVSKATLREKLSILPPDSRARFSPLGLELASPSRSVTPPSERPPIRSELPPSPAESRPASGAPAAGRSAPPPLSVLAANLPSIASAGGLPPIATAPVTTFTPLRSSAPPPTRSTLQPVQGAPPPAALPSPLLPPRQGSAAPPSVAPKERSPGLDDLPRINVSDDSDVDLEMSSDHLETIPELGETVVTSEVTQGDRLITSLKRILALSKDGKNVEAYKEYGLLFAHEDFAALRPEEQRQALKLMILAKSHPTDDADDIVASAHRAALVRLQSLVDAGAEPQDQELLGVTHLFLGDPKAASAAFQAGLDVERVRNPQSDLIASLMRRVSQI